MRSGHRGARHALWPVERPLEEVADGPLVVPALDRPQLGPDRKQERVRALGARCRREHDVVEHLAHTVLVAHARLGRRIVGEQRRVAREGGDGALEHGADAGGLERQLRPRQVPVQQVGVLQVQLLLGRGRDRRA